MIKTSMVTKVGVTIIAVANSILTGLIRLVAVETRVVTAVVARMMDSIVAGLVAPIFTGIVAVATIADSILTSLIRLRIFLLFIEAIVRAKVVIETSMVTKI